MLHRDHHTYTNDPTRDPELLAGSPANSMPTSRAAYAKHVLRLGGGDFGFGVWAARARILAAGARGTVVGYSGSDLVPQTKAAAVRAGLQTSCRRQLLFYACLIAALAASHGFGAAARFWLVPMLLGEPRDAASAVGAADGDATGGVAWKTVVAARRGPVLETGAARALAVLLMPCSTSRLGATPFSTRRTT
jgi:hypothetical protein